MQAQRFALAFTARMRQMFVCCRNSGALSSLPKETRKLDRKMNMTGSNHRPLENRKDPTSNEGVDRLHHKADAEPKTDLDEATQVAVPQEVDVPLPPTPKEQIAVPASINGRDLSKGQP